MSDDVQSLIMAALKEVGQSMSVDQVLVESGIELDQEFEGSFVAFEMRGVDSDPVGDRIQRDPKRTVMRHECTVDVLASFYAVDDLDVARIKSTALVEFANGVASSKGLRKVSFNYRVSRQRFYRGMDTQNRIVLRAVCNVFIVYRTYANDTAVAIQPQ